MKHYKFCYWDLLDILCWLRVGVDAPDVRAALRPFLLFAWMPKRHLRYIIWLFMTGKERSKKCFFPEGTLIISGSLLTLVECRDPPHVSPAKLWNKRLPLNDNVIVSSPALAMQSHAHMAHYIPWTRNVIFTNPSQRMNKSKSLWLVQIEGNSNGFHLLHRGHFYIRSMSSMIVHFSSMGLSHSKILYGMSLSCQPTLSVSRHSISPICDHGGPRQSPKTSRDTPQIAAFSFVHSLTG